MIDDDFISEEEVKKISRRSMDGFDSRGCFPRQKRKSTRYDSSSRKHGVGPQVLLRSGYEVQRNCGRIPIRCCLAGWGRSLVSLMGTPLAEGRIFRHDPAW